MELRKQLLDVKGKYDQLANEYEGLYQEHEELRKKYEELHSKYTRIRNENEGLKELLSKKSKPVKIEDAWTNLFPAEPVPDERVLAIAVEKLGLAGKVVVGQGYIFAEEEELIEELLKTVYLSLAIKEDKSKAEKPANVGEQKKEGEKPESGEDFEIIDAGLKPDELL